MKDFMSCDFTVTAVRFVIYVERGKGAGVFENRASHGIALNLSSMVKTYVFSDGRTVNVGQNDIIYLPKGSSYRVLADMSGDCYAINFDISDEVNFSPFVIGAKNVSGFVKRFEKAQTLFRNKSGPYQMRCKSILYEILAMMQSEYTLDYVNSSTAMLISPAIEYIHEHYTDVDIGISGMAQMCGISEDYFRKIFKNTYGTSPVKYISDLKISYAKELLSSGTYTVSKVAQLSGFTDTSYFSREFKKSVGVCPSDYV